MRAPCVIRWPGHIKPGTVLNDIFSSLDWVPTFVEIAGGPKGDGLKKQIEKGEYPGIVKTTLDGVNQIDYLTGKSDKSARDSFLYYSGKQPSAVRYKNWKMYFAMVSDDPSGFITGVVPYSWTQVVNIKRDPFETSVGQQLKTLFGTGGALAGPMTAYVYDWNMLPIGQALWLKHLQTYIDFPPLQDPASYNLDQVMQQVREMKNPKSIVLLTGRPSGRPHLMRTPVAALARKTMLPDAPLAHHPPSVARGVMKEQIQAIVTVLSLVNPAICGAMFAQIEANRSRGQQVADATKAVLATMVILAISALIGTQLLHLFGVSLDAFMVAGGGVLAWMGFSMLRGQATSPTSGNAPPHSGASLTPLVLFAASPGTITGVITLSAAHTGLDLPVTALVAIAVAGLVTWLVLLLVSASRRQGQRGRVCT